MVKIKPRIIATLLRFRGYHNVPQLIMHFESHIWGLMEAETGDNFTASDFFTRKHPSCPKPFLRELSISVEQALSKFIFVAPRIRRNICVLDMFHKRVLGKCHPSFNLLLPWHSSRFDVPRAFGHDKQLYGHNVEEIYCQSLWDRLISAIIDAYNILPQHNYDASSAKIFQQFLIHIVRTRCQQDNQNWPSSFCGRVYGQQPILSHCNLLNNSHARFIDKSRETSWAN